ncbi:hypothetical protein ASF30_12190 [Leifsonia sp. Leaf264]|nr:hypothetical protein ASF30_12190 [Leifsonia sp. Leaf264]
MADSTVSGPAATPEVAVTATKGRIGCFGVNVIMLGLAAMVGIGVFLVQSFDDPVISPSCDTSMADAADVAELNNDRELLRTATGCSTADEWVAALKAHPGAGALTTYTDEDAHGLLALLCVKASDTELCADASQRGLLDFELDDPRLEDL